MKKTMFYQAVLMMAVAVFSACSSDEQTPGVAPAGQPQTWTVVGSGEINDDGEQATRALSLGGSTGTILYSTWEDGDIVKVLSGTAEVGTLTVETDPTNKSKADFTGTITTTGTYTPGDELTYITPAADMDFSGQNGTLAVLSSTRNYMKATVRVTSVDENKRVITTSAASFDRVAKTLLLKFKDESDNVLVPDRITITSEGNHIILSETAAGVKTYGPLVVNCADKASDYPYENPYVMYVALRTDTPLDTYVFTVNVGSDTYESSTAEQKWTESTDLKYWRITRTLTLQQKAVTSTNTITGWGDGGTTTESITE